MIADLSQAVRIVGADGRLTAEGWMELQKLVLAIRAAELADEAQDIAIADHEARITTLEP